MSSRNRDYFDLNAHQRPMVGDTKTSALAVDHIGWLVCDGRLLDVDTWQNLFKTIHYSFGGSGTQFRLPNPAGRVAGYIGAGAGLTTRTKGNSVGTETHTLTVAEMPTHNHAITDNGHTHTGNTSNSVTGIEGNTVDTPESESVSNLGTGAQVSGSGQRNAIKSDNGHTHAFTTGSSFTGVTTNNNGSSNAHNNMQPTLFIGNLFIYSGKPFYANYPFTAGTNIV